MALMTADCVFENTLAAPDGERFEGATAVRGFWKILSPGRGIPAQKQLETVIRMNQALAGVL